MDAYETGAQDIADLYASYAPAIVRHLERMTHDRETAEDLAQETFIKALRDPQQLASVGNARAWLFRVATHTAYDFLRRARRDSKCDGIEGAEALRADTPDPSDYTLVRERAALVSRLLDTLSAKDRTFVELYYGEGLPAEEVAERMQISVKTVYTKKHKLRGRLESLLESGREAA